MYKRCYISNLLVNASASFLVNLWLNYVDVKAVKEQLVQRKFTDMSTKQNKIIEQNYGGPAT